MRARFDRDPEQTLVDVDMGMGVVLQLVRDDREPDRPWEVWAVKIGDVLYREPRDMEGEPLADCDFAEWLAQESLSNANYRHGNPA